MILKIILRKFILIYIMNNYITLLIKYTNSEENQIASLVDFYNGEILDYYESENKVCNIIFNSYTLFEKIESELADISIIFVLSVSLITQRFYFLSFV